MVKAIVRKKVSYSVMFFNGAPTSATTQVLNGARLKYYGQSNQWHHSLIEDKEMSEEEVAAFFKE